MAELSPQLTPEEKHQWQQSIAEADRYNILCYCQQCHYEWIASTRERCKCGSTKIEHIACWQFPDD